jgi:polysaccharide deacetylase family protein (PEP-CTERM system associated)
MVNIVSIDLEDYYMVSAFEGAVKREDWCKYESRIEHSGYRILDILENYRLYDELGNGSGMTNFRSAAPSIKATFFCLGLIGERYPGLIKEIKKRGHEIASHGFDHQLIYQMNARQFREDIRRTKILLEDIIGEEVIGYRAPSYSITKETMWALEILAEEGFRYDSSIFPIYHDRYGIPEAHRFPFSVNFNKEGVCEARALDGKYKDFKEMVNEFSNSKNSQGLSVLEGKRSAVNRIPNVLQTLIEFPISTTKVWGVNFPISGGGYFRIIPYWIIKMGLRRINHTEKKPFIFYIHPWEIDLEQPRLGNLSRLSRFRHYTNLKNTEGKLVKLFNHFKFTSFKKALEI